MKTKVCQHCRRLLGARNYAGMFCNTDCMFKYQLGLTLKPDARETMS